MTPPRPIPDSMLTPDLAARIEGQLQRSASGCLEWQGWRNRGYAALSVGNVNYRVSRIIYAFQHGDPGEAYILHSCDNPPCCDLAHLRAGTQIENAADRHTRGRYIRLPRTGQATPNSRVIPFRLTPEQGDALDAYAESQGVSVSALLRSLILPLIEV